MSADITIFRCAVGGVALVNYGMISDCAVSADMGGELYAFAGGIAAFNRGVIANCDVRGSFSFTDSFNSNSAKLFGGVVGMNFGLRANTAILGSAFTGSVTVKDISHQVYIGGIAGNSRSGPSPNYYPATIEGCRVDASLAAMGADDATYVWPCTGGIAGGVSDTAVIRNSSFRGSLGGAYVGGIFGSTSASGGGTSAIVKKITGCTADFTLDDASTSRTNMVIAGGIAGQARSGIIENCFASADLHVADLALPNVNGENIYIGGIAGSIGSGYPSTIQNCVAAGRVRTSRASGTYIYMGGLTGVNFDDVTIKDCVSLSDVSNPTGVFPLMAVGTLIGAAPEYDLNDKISDCRWLRDSSVNNSTPTLPIANTYEGNRHIFQTDKNISMASASADLPQAAAILTPGYAALRMGDAPVEFTVKTYPVESAATGNVISGLWVSTGDAVSLTETGLARASVSPVSAGEATVLFHVVNTGNPNASLFGGYTPSLSAKVAVLEALPVPPVPDSDKSISEIWTEIGGVKYAADGDGVILLPEGTDVAALPIWIAMASDKAAVSPPASGDAYDFSVNDSRVFTVTAEDETSAQYTVSVWVEESLVIGDIVDTDDIGIWEAEALVRKDGSVRVSLWMPMSIDPALIDSIENVAAETSGFVPGSVTFAITQGDKVIKDFSLGSSGAGAAGDDSQPYTLLFSATCASEADYASASLGKIVFRISGETYEQDLDVTVSTDTDVTLTREEKDDEPDDPTPPVDPGDGNNDGGSGGCGAGTAPLAALGAAAFALTRKKKI